MKDFESNTTRMMAQMNLIDANLMSRGIISTEYISYKYKIDNPKLVKSRSIIVSQVPLYFIAMYETEFSKIKNEYLLSVAKEMRPRIKKHISDTGVGDIIGGVSPWITNASDDGTFYVNFPITKKGFLEFYKNVDIQKPPPYFEDYFDFLVESKKERQWTNNEAYDRNILSEEQIDKINKYKLEYLGSERRARFNYVFERPSGLPDLVYKSKWSIQYRSDTKILPNMEPRDIKTGIRCSALGESGRESVNLKVEKLIFIDYPWKQIKKCKPYKKWYQCHMLMQHYKFRKCDEIPLEEPEMCE